MKLSETGQLLQYIANFDGRKLTPERTEAWHDVLGYLEYEQAKEAVIMTTRDESIKWIEPRHIISKIQAMKEQSELAERQKAAQEYESTKVVGVPMPKCKHDIGLLYCDPCCHDEAVKQGLKTGPYKPRKTLEQLLS